MERRRDRECSPNLVRQPGGAAARLLHGHLLEWRDIHVQASHLLAEQGAPILELVNLEALSADAVYEFAFIGGSLKLRGADAAPIRPIAIPLRN